MWDQGYLDTGQMAGAFQLLRSNDLVWSRDGARLPAGRARADDRPDGLERRRARACPTACTAEYLRSLFLDNDLAQGRYEVDGEPVALSDIRVPIFAVGTEHATTSRPGARSTRSTCCRDTDVTFVLTSGGHNAGIVSEPGHPHRSYRVATSPPASPTSTPTNGRRARRSSEGSWWPAWQAWLAAALHRPGAEPPPMGAPERGLPPLGDAPGTYVLQR